MRGDRAPLRPLPLLLAIGLAGCSQPEAVEQAAAPAEAAGSAQEERDVLYALGGWLARNLAGVKIEEKDLAPLQEGLADALLGRPLRVEPKEIGVRVQAFLADRRAELAADEKRAAAGFLAEAKQQPGAQRRPSGLIYLSLAEGQGETPKLNDQVKVLYEGTLRDGSSFDSTKERGPALFGVNRVVPCWTEALQLMKPGGKARITCPSDLAYGDRGMPGRILPGAPLRFELELLEIVPASAATPAPAPVPATP